MLARLLFEAGAISLHFSYARRRAGCRGQGRRFVTTLPKIGALVAADRFVDALPQPWAGP